MKIRVEGVTLRLRIGAYPGEQDFEREVVLNFEIEGDWDMAAAADDLSLTVDYAELSRGIIERFSGRSYRLLEALASDVLKHILSVEGVRRARVEVIKVRPAEGIGRAIVSAEGSKQPG